MTSLRANCNGLMSSDPATQLCCTDLCAHQLSVLQRVLLRSVPLPCWLSGVTNGWFYCMSRRWRMRRWRQMAALTAARTSRSSYVPQMRVIR